MITVLVGISRILFLIAKIGLGMLITSFIGALVLIVILQIDCYIKYKKFCKLTKEDLSELMEVETLFGCFYIGLIFYIVVLICYMIGAS